jgi:hypothetical protein
MLGKMRVFAWRTRKEKTTLEASGESKQSGGGRMKARFIWHRKGSSGRLL